MKQRWDETDKSWLRLLAADRKSSREIGLTMGRSARSVSAMACRLKIKIRITKPSKLTAEQKAHVREWARQRAALGNIKSKAAELKVSKATVIKWINEDRA